METTWINNLVAELKETSHDYREKALLAAAQRIYEEQAIRKEQMEGQLDGTLWSPKSW
ncbi:hypothetical protein G7081_03875 [Vagococcus coleopterorum]|uniref:Uncharacterized protein n=1 Tax=Vagococcus coleopterorum TaxID=2714946 RepID=A0A6G8AMP3_9ENTE|nr:hypothetical protein [Vagococcus coleopterorum]QIL46266.1 hypothetical protein G7081_03875 [Vagococcus coleopterorum]